MHVRKCNLITSCPQGEKNLSLVWFVLKQLGIRTPSLTSVKNFKLPEMEAPLRVRTNSSYQYHLFLLQHSSSEDDPFHSISLTSIVRQCLGNYDVAKNVKRYPVYVGDTFRYLAMH